MSNNTEAKRNVLVADAVAKLEEAESALAELIETWGDEKVSAAHPRSGLKMSKDRIYQIRKSLKSMRGF